VDVYKINQKAVVLVFFLQLVVGGIWYASTPTALLGRSILEDTSEQPSIIMAVLFVLSVLVYLLFTAWLLVRIKGMSGPERFFLVIAIWFFIVLPNYIFVSMQLNFSEVDVFYLLSYSAINCAIAAIILPLWRSSRSIFKT
jgi:hypothetical protein